MHRQLEILNILASEFYHSIGNNFDSAIFEYKFNKIGNWSVISAYYIKDNKKLPPIKDNIYENRIEKLCEELHELMQNQTGGDWQKFILKINEKKEVETEFSYEP